MRYIHARLLGTALTLASGSAAAQEGGPPPEPERQPGPRVFGQLNIGYEALNNGVDDGFRVNRATLGFTGSLGYGPVRAIYNLEADLSDVVPPDTSPEAPGFDNQGVKVRTAQIILPSRRYGVLVLGRGFSGYRRDVYAGMDIFDNDENYNPVNDSYIQSDGLFAQPLYGQGTLAYASPVFANTRVVGAVLSVNDANDRAADVLALRVVYAGNGITAGAGAIQIDSSGLPGPDDYLRTAAGVNYESERFQVGATIENNSDHPSGDFTVLGVAGTFYATPKVALKAGFFDKDHDDVPPLDNTAVILNASYYVGRTGIDQELKVYLEHEEHDIDALDKTSLGLRLRF